MASNTFSPWSWRHVQVPSSWTLRVATRDVPPKSLLLGKANMQVPVILPEQCWLDGAWVYNTSCTAWIRNLSAAVSDLKRYAQVICPAVVSLFHLGMDFGRQSHLTSVCFFQIPWWRFLVLRISRVLAFSYRLRGLFPLFGKSNLKKQE